MMAMMDLAMMKKNLSFAIRRCGMRDEGIIVFIQVEQSAELSEVGIIVSSR